MWLHRYKFLKGLVDHLVQSQYEQNRVTVVNVHIPLHYELHVPVQALSQIKALPAA